MPSQRNARHHSSPIPQPGRRRLLRGVAGASASSLLLPGLVRGQAGYPSKAITVICPFPPGGLNDTCARVVARTLEGAFRQPAITENRPGASSMIGMAQLARTAPDGHTLITCSDRIVCYPTIGALPFDIENDFAPVTRLVVAPMFLITRPGLGVSTVNEFIALAKRNSSLTFASTGLGSSTHLAGEVFQARAGVKMVHVPYKGAVPGLTDVIAGHVDLMFADLGTAAPFVRGGRAKPIAVGSLQRSVTFPDVPTFTEAGLPGFEARVWIGLLARAGTPAPIIQRINHEVVAALRHPETARVLTDSGTEIATTTPEEFVDLITRERARLAPVLRAANIKSEGT